MTMQPAVGACGGVLGTLAGSGDPAEEALVSAPTPAPPPGGGPAPQRRPRRRALVIVLVSVLAVGLVCCGGAGFALYRYLDDSAENPGVAIDRYLRALESGDPADMKRALCSRDQDRAEGIIREYRATFASAGQELRDLQWTITAQEPRGKSQYRMTVQVTTYVARAGKEYRRRDLKTYDVVDGDGWRVCGPPE